MTLQVLLARTHTAADTGHGQKQEAADLTHKEAPEVTGALPVPQGVWEI